MATLQLVGIHDDGEHLLLATADGTEYTLPIDQNLRTSIAKARRIQPVRGRSASGTFGPRDIQTRFRQGASVEEIVAESGWEADRVRRYEWPILAERANIISTARRSVISQAAGRRSEGTALSLDQHIEQVAEKFGFTGASSDWNTFQQDSGQWTVSVDFDLSDEVKNSLPRTLVFPARWSFNPANQSIYASNEAAYFLMGRDHGSGSPIPDQGETAESQSASEQPEPATEVLEATGAPKSSLSVISAPKPSSQDEVLGELENRRGIRDFNSARERKLADLLERARRSSESAHSPLSAPVAPAPAEEPQAESQEVSATKSASSPETSTEQAPVLDKDISALVPTAEKEAGEPAPQVSAQHFEAESPVDVPLDAPRAGRRFAPAPAAEPEASQEPRVVADDESSSPAQTPADLGQEQDSTTAVQPAETNPADQTVEEPKEASGNQAESTKSESRPANRAKRTSVPSWDDIIFGNQRR